MEAVERVLARVDAWRQDVEGDTWRAVKRFVAGALALTVAALLASPVPALFLLVAFLALVLWFVALGLLVQAARESLAARGA